MRYRSEKLKSDPNVVRLGCVILVVSRSNISSSKVSALRGVATFLLSLTLSVKCVWIAKNLSRFSFFMLYIKPSLFVAIISTALPVLLSKKQVSTKFFNSQPWNWSLGGQSSCISLWKERLSMSPNGSVSSVSYNSSCDAFFLSVFLDLKHPTLFAGDELLDFSDRLLVEDISTPGDVESKKLETIWRPIFRVYFYCRWGLEFLFIKKESVSEIFSFF